jgi:hypothetical protein
MWALAYAVQNRITIGDLNDPSPPTTAASELPIQTFLPDQDDWAFLASEMASVVEGILCKHFTFFQEQRCCETRKHAFTTESREKSNIVSNV